MSSQEIIKKIKQEALEMKLPIILDDMQIFLSEFVKKNKPKEVLEIGTANGFSGAVLLSSFNDLNLTSIEKNTERFLKAKENLSLFENRVNLVNADAIDFLKENKKKFDFIFLDGPKGQYINYLPFLIDYLNIDGVLIADNIFLHGMVTGETFVSKTNRTMVRNLGKFIECAKASTKLNIEILNFADGVLVAKKKETKKND